MSTHSVNVDVYSIFSHNCQNLEAIRLTLTSLNTFALRSFIFFYATRPPLTLNFSLLIVKTDFSSAYSVMDFSTPDIPHRFALFLCLTFKCPTLHQFLLTSFSERSCCRWSCQWTSGSPYKALPVTSDWQFFPSSCPDFPVLGSSSCQPNLCFPQSLEWLILYFA